MSQNNDPNQNTKCLENLVESTAEDTKLSEFLKTTKDKLDELVKGVAAEEQSYRDARSELVGRWREQDKKITETDAHLRKCYDVECFKKKIICEKVIAPLREKRRRLLDSLGNPDYCLELATELYNKTMSDLESWKGIKQWITDRLDKDKALLEEICEENCKDPCFVIYLFYFELRPAHIDLNPDRDKDSSGGWAECKDWDACNCGPDGTSEGPCKRDCEECKVSRVCTPYLIDPDLYDCRLAAAWKAWKDAGTCMVKAQCRVDQVKKLREDYAEANKPESRRKEARDAIRRYKSDCCAPAEPPPNDDCGPNRSNNQSAY